MSQLHRRFTDEQVRVLFQSYCKGKMSRVDIQEMLNIGKSRFFVLLNEYRQNPETFSIAYKRRTHSRLSAETEKKIEMALLKEKEIVEDPDLPISGYNYTAMRDRLRKEGIEVSITTIIDRAKKLDCHKPRRKRKVHDREVLTASIGALVQHDASLHLWAPEAKEKWTLITSIDDYSRKILFADFVLAETTWTHIQATQALIMTYGLPLRYYVDSLRVFRFVQGRDSFWRKHVLETDDVVTQWGKIMQLLNVDVTYALSPQAKGKVERPYRWLQDRMVRTCIYEEISDIEGCRSVLRDEIDRYNNHQVHSTTREIPSIRFERALKSGNSLFRKFSLPKPYTSPLDVFCLRAQRMVNGYRRISLFKHQIEVPKVPLREYVDVHMVPDTAKDVMHIRIWWKEEMVHSVSLPLKGFRVHF
jgi:transposase